MTAASGRPDYNQLIKVGSLAPGEPLFVIRAQDECAAEAVRAWAAIAYARGAPVEAVELALQQADRMEVWPAKKRPDGPDLPDHQRKDLRNQHQRRAWRSQQTVPDIGHVMAEQLGRSGVVGQVRPLLDDLLRRGAFQDDGTFTYDPPRGPGGEPDFDACPLARLYRVLGSNLAARAAIIQGEAEAP